MQAFSVLIIALCFCLVWGQNFAPTFTSPVFMWSNTQYFNGKNVHVSEYSSVDNIALGLLSSKENPLGKYFNDARTNPEAIFVFIEPELRTEHFPLLADAYSVQPNGGAFSKLKGTLESYSTSSLVVPYTHVGEEKSIGSSIVMQLGRHLSKGASIIFASEDSESLQSLDKMSVSRISLEELKNLATKDWSIFSNGVTDIVIVSFDSPAVHADNVQEVAPSYAADDAYMHDLLQNIEGSYVAIYTADKPANEGVKLARATMMVRQLAASTGIYPAAIVEAQIVMIPFLFILFVGLCCTYSVQSDLKFDAEKKNLKK